MKEAQKGSASNNFFFAADFSSDSNRKRDNRLLSETDEGSNSPDSPRKKQKLADNDSSSENINYQRNSAPENTPSPTKSRQELENIRVELEGRELWERFSVLGTEMIITKAGR